MKIFKTKKRSYTIIPIHSKSGATCNLFFLTASPNKDLDEWKTKLEALDTVKNYHNIPNWAVEEESKFWEDWDLIWRHRGPGETEYKLYRNKYDRDVFLYEVWDIDIDGYHIKPGRYYLDYQVLTAKDVIQFKTGIWRDYDIKEMKIEDLLKENEFVIVS